MVGCCNDYACLAFTLSLNAQVETTTTTAAGNANVVTKVERGEVVTVSGNDLVVKMATALSEI